VQDVVRTVYPDLGYTVSLVALPPEVEQVYSTSGWFTDTDTALQIGPGTGRVGLGSGGPTLALR
jgi:hypothetical protein